LQRFTVPSLPSLELKTRFEIMKSLSDKWGNYANDEELVTSLKLVRFIPKWNLEANGYWDCDFGSEEQAQAAADVFTWQNNELMAALKGSDFTK